MNRENETEFAAGPDGDAGSASTASGCSPWSGCLTGCLITVVVVVLLVAGGAWYAYQNATRWVTRSARQMALQVINDVELTPEEEAAILEQFERLEVAAALGDLELSDLSLLSELNESGLVGAWMVFSIQSNYISPSDLSEEEKSQGLRVLQRVARGAYEKSIDDGQLKSLGDFVTTTDGAGQKTLKEVLTTEELREFLAAAGAMADEAEVPDEPFEMKISDELREIVDKILDASEDSDSEVQQPQPGAEDG